MVPKTVPDAARGHTVGRMGPLRMLVMVTLIALVTGCSGSSGTPAPAGTTASAVATATAGTGGTPADPEAAKAEITQNWEKFFASDTPRAVAVRLLENGDSLGPALRMATEEQRQLGGQRSATVSDVEFTSATQASVHYELQVGDQTLPATGVAVLQGGTWKVGDITFCTLVELGSGGKPVKGCHVRRNVDYTAHTVTVKVPRSCLGNPVKGCSA